MSKRPISVDELIGKIQPTQALSKPKFLSKQERQKLSLQRNQDIQDKKRQQTVINNGTKRRYSNPIEVTSESKNIRKKLKKGKNFNFDWDEEEDTSLNYQPLVRYDTSANPPELGLTDKHWSEKQLEEMTTRDWRIFKEDYNITSKGGDIDNPLRSWAESKLPTKLLNILIKDLDYDSPTPIQRASIPLALNARDIVGIAETGSGKTLAFLLPLFSYILSVDSNYLSYEHQQESNFNKPLGLILAPTRELALQITKEAKLFGDKLNMNVVTIIGGHQYEETVHSVRDGVHIVVATPGRLIDSLERGIINLSKCYFFTMDEADKMIDMGFEKSLQSILTYLPTSEELQTTMDGRIFNIKKRITLMFTATISPPIEKITKNYLIKPGYLFIGNVGEAVDNINQQFEYFGSQHTSDGILDPKKMDKLFSILRFHKDQNRNYSIIIFANFKKTCEELSFELGRKGFSENTVIHGSKSQEARERAIESFREGKDRILIATDVAARGIDIPNVSLVVNYQMTKKFDEYIHRIGRTGRAGNKGTSCTFIDDGDSEVFLDLKKFLNKGNKKCPEWLLKHASTQSQILRD
ncbi:Pre-mRNA-splicing ATP-dependent RNA helicase PRP28 [Debaryomyces fabryi]|uniref:RNA helicase n=1 Tax=Debaryomyces fabryi TaxID=58627 RepID=A0A0V1Q632_9ASCO|nr:Pre-mRNA-splicing ATP-dependent RNA helicase PRP28 [Debaryomyces fabryi]KSA03818.1 Pre-mRNA-splicing ATP-dependent RNA helicase PRP28 [Debaryomyces fabryi]CUM45338.1 unnamed protein product [Debaryomyces fabryi]